MEGCVCRCGCVVAVRVQHIHDRGDAAPRADACIGEALQVRAVPQVLHPEGATAAPSRDPRRQPMHQV